MHGNVAELGTLKPHGKGMLGPLRLTEVAKAWEHLVTSERAAVVVGGCNWSSFGTRECPACLSLLLLTRSPIHPQSLHTRVPSPALDGFFFYPCAPSHLAEKN